MEVGLVILVIVFSYIYFLRDKVSYLNRQVEELKELKSVWHLAESFAVEFFDLFYQEGEFISPLLIEEIFATEDYYVKPYTVYEDWLGTPINLRKNGE